MTKWRLGTVTRYILEQVVKMHGIPRHVKHIRPRNKIQQGRMGDVAGYARIFFNNF